MWPGGIRLAVCVGARMAKAAPFILRSRSAAIAIAGLLYFATQVAAQSATLAWNANTESDLAGYILEYGTQAGYPSTSLNVGKVTQRQITGLRAGTRYYFRVRAYDTSGLRSTPSNEVAYTVPLTPPPSLTAVSPTSGPTSGGTVITLAGSGFRSGATVRVGRKRATGVSVVSSSQIRATTPPGSAGAQSVRVTNTDGQSDVLSGAFTYRSSTSTQPSLTSIAPTSGPASGGIPLTLKGSYFVSGATVTIGGASAKVTFVSSSELRVTTPALSVGTHTVAVRNPNGQSDVLVSAFTTFSSTGAPTFSSVSPTSGPTTGGTLVTIRGTGFASGVTVYVGQSKLTSLQLISSTEIRGRTPAGSGLTFIRILNSNGKYVYAANVFRYISSTSLTSAAEMTSAAETMSTAETASATETMSLELDATAETTRALAPDGDLDGDGLPTEWEQRFGLAPDSADGVDGASGDADGDGTSNADELENGTHPRGLFRRYLGIGGTGPDVDTRLTIANPGDAASLVLSFVDETGAVTRVPASVPASSRLSLDRRTMTSLDGRSFSIALESDQPVALDRVTTSGTGETRLDTAVERPTTRWYLPRSSARGGSTLTYEVANAEDRPAEVEVRYLTQDGAAAVNKRYTVEPRGRVVIDVRQEDASLAQADVAAEIEAVNDTSIVAAAHAAAKGYIESTNGVPLVEAFTDSGTVEAAVNDGARTATGPETAGRWLVAEAEQGGVRRAATSLVVSNAAAAPVRVAVTLLGGRGAGRTATFEVGAQDRLTLPLASVFPRAEGHFAILVEAEDPANASGIVVERKTLWHGRDGRVIGAGGVAASLP
jgi:hypothetical protein